MRRSDIIFAILLILSVIEFALAAPVQVQEKGQAWVDVDHIPRDMMTVLRKRGSDDMEKLVEALFGTWDKPVESSDAHALSSSAPPVPDHGSMNDVEAPVPNSASSPTNPEPLMEPLTLSDGTDTLMDELLGTWDKPVESSDAHASSSSAPPVPDHGSMNDGKAPTPNPASSPTNLDPSMEQFSLPETQKLMEKLFEKLHKSVESSDAHASSSSAPPLPDHGPMNDVNAPVPNPESPPANPDPLMRPLSPSSIAHPIPVMHEDALSEPDYEWLSRWLYDNGGDPLVPLASPTSIEFGPDHELTEDHVSRPNTNPEPSTGPNPNFDETSLDDQPPAKRPKLGRRKSSARPMRTRCNSRTQDCGIQDFTTPGRRLGPGTGW